MNERIAGSLIAIAARTAISKYFDQACVSLLSETELRTYYKSKYRMMEGGPQLADSFVFPVKLSTKQQKAADLQFTEARQHVRKKITEAEKPNTEYSFGYFLKLYIELLDMKRRGFAEQTGMDENLLSQLSINIVYLLNIHPFGLNCTQIIRPRLNTGLGFEKDRKGTMLLNKAAMIKKEMKYVTRGISVHL